MLSFCTAQTPTSKTSGQLGLPAHLAMPFQSLTALEFPKRVFLRADRTSNLRCRTYNLVSTMKVTMAVPQLEL